MKKNKSDELNRVLGDYFLDSSEVAFGELNLKGVNTLLTLHSKNNLERFLNHQNINGRLYSGKCITLIDCINSGYNQGFHSDGNTQYQHKVFPHYVAIGNCHLDPKEDCISSLEFTTSDLGVLFYDYDAFGSVINSSEVIDYVLKNSRKSRAVDFGEHPIINYFNGKTCVFESSVDSGVVSVEHRPTTSSGSPSGIYIKNNLIARFKPASKLNFIDAIDEIYKMSSFFSVLAGRYQGIKNIRMTLSDESLDRYSYLDIKLSFKHKKADKGNSFKPHPGDLPIKPFVDPDKFGELFSKWMASHKYWRVARNRYLGCIRKGNKYDTDRIVAAANMFDLLPSDAVPLVTDLSDELSVTVRECKLMFRKHPVGIDRNSALDALGRLGKPSLPKKVLYRASIVDAQLNSLLPKLDFVAGVAVKCRNFFVHGSSGDIDYEKVEPLVPFLTDTLEFIFSASDLIESGWDAKKWALGHLGHSHRYSNYIHGYRAYLKELESALEIFQ